MVPRVSAPYRPMRRFIDPRRGVFDKPRYQRRNRAYNASARVIQKAAADMARTKRYNMVRQNPMVMVHRYAAKKAVAKPRPKPLASRIGKWTFKPYKPKY